METMATHARAYLREKVGGCVEMEPGNDACRGHPYVDVLHSHTGGGRGKRTQQCPHRTSTRVTLHNPLTTENPKTQSIPQATRLSTCTPHLRPASRGDGGQGNHVLEEVW